MIIYNLKSNIKNGFSNFEKKRKDILFWHALAQSTLFYLMALSLIKSNTLIMLYAVIGSVIYCTVTNIHSSFSFVFALSVFESVFNINGDNASIILLSILIIKLLFYNNFKLSFSFRTYMVGLAVLLIIEIMNDFLSESIGQMLVNVILLCFLSIILMNIEKFEIDIYQMIISLSLSFFAVIYYVITMYGGISVYINQLLTSFYAFRFGHTYGETVGGAMAIPLYAIMILSMSVSYLIRGKKVGKLRLVVLITCMVAAVVFGALTISRSFYLCIAVMLLLVVLSSNRRNYKSVLRLLFLVAIVMTILIIIFPNIISTTLMQLIQRVEMDSSGGSGGRLQIWVSCFKYLFSYPLRFMIGSGGSRYVEIGAAEGLDFSAGSHNLIIDILMSWGIIGFGIIFFWIVDTLKRIKSKSFLKYLSNYIPLFCYFVFSLTALRTTNMKTWMFLLASIMIVNILNKENKVYDT